MYALGLSINEVPPSLEKSTSKKQESGKDVQKK
jgi:hypothetical protein